VRQHGVVMAEPTEMYGEYKVLPNGGSLLIGMLASAILGLSFLGAAGWWKGISVLLSGVFVVCFYQLYWPRPIIRANREGLYLSIGTLGRPFYVPWERVNGVVLTKVWSLAGPDSYSHPTDALGFVIQQDDAFRLPSVRWNAAGDTGEVHSDISFDKGMIQGDVKTWVAKLEAFRKDIRGLS
jgi:hypothetical protein